VAAGDVSFNTSCSESGAGKPSKSWFLWNVCQQCSVCTLESLNCVCYYAIELISSLRVPFFKWCRWNVELTQTLGTCTSLCVLDIPFGNSTSNETQTGLFSVIIYRRINFGSWELYVCLFIKCSLFQ